jgi:DnaJ-domain-containing protein 1
MGILDRLGNVIKSYLNDTETGPGGQAAGPHERRNRRDSGDNDYDAAYQELDDFLNGKEKPETREEPGAGSRNKSAGEKKAPEELRGDFAELGVPFGASGAVCKEAYKKLLKTHHPDRHAGHAGNLKKATEKSARINAAYDRIETWRKGDSL